MKKLQLLPVMFLMLMVLVGCGSVNNAASSPEPTVEVSTTPEPTPTPTATAIPTDTPEPTKEASADLSGWQKAYISYIENNSRDEYGKNFYCLIYLDDDDIPELLDFGVSEADGTRVVIYSNGSYSENQMSRLSVQYIPRGNLLLNNEGNMGYYTATVYSIVDGTLTAVAGGTQSQDMEASERDSNGFVTTFHYNCTWKGEPVSEDEYAANLNAAFDSSKAVAPSPPVNDSAKTAQGFYSASQMIAALNSGNAIPYSSN